MPYCPNCGKKVKEDQKFCSECGTRLAVPKGGERVERVIVKEAPVKKGPGLGTFFVVLLVLLGGFYFFFVYLPSQRGTETPIGVIREVVKAPKPALSVDASITPSWSFGKGCYGNVAGTVYNRGDANANGVYVTCRVVTTKGSTIGSGSTTVGDIYAGSSRSFSMTIDYSCPIGEEVRVSCTADCANC